MIAIEWGTHQQQPRLSLNDWPTTTGRSNDDNKGTCPLVLLALLLVLWPALVTGLRLHVRLLLQHRHLHRHQRPGGGCLSLTMGAEAVAEAAAAAAVWLLRAFHRLGRRRLSRCRVKSATILASMMAWI